MFLRVCSRSRGQNRSRVLQQEDPCSSFCAFSKKRNPLIAPRGGAQCACVNISPAGKLHHGGERPCAGSQRQETQADIRWALTGEPCRCLVNMRVMCAGACAWSRKVVVVEPERGGGRCGPTSSNHGVCCLQRPMTVHLTRAATSPGQTRLPRVRRWSRVSPCHSWSRSGWCYSAEWCRHVCRPVWLILKVEVLSPSC